MNVGLVDPTATCQGCGHPFTRTEGQRQSRRYCTDRCKMRYFRQQALRQARPPTTAPMPWEAPVLHHGRFEDFAEAYRGQIDVLLVDPPYDRASLPVYDALQALASTVLVPGGYFLCLTGKGLLPELLPRLSVDTLAYVTVIDYVYTNAVQAQGWTWTATGKRVWQERAKPLLWYERTAPPRPPGTRGRHPFKRFPGGTDRIEVQAEPDLAAQQQRYPDLQSLAGFRAILSMYTTPSDVILDPCMGWGTTLQAALSVDRRRVIGIEKDGIRYQHARQRLGLAPSDSPAKRDRPSQSDLDRSGSAS